MRRGVRRRRPRRADTCSSRGCGAVGDRLAEQLHEAGATLRSPTSTPSARPPPRESVGATRRRPHHVIDTECDVFSPCATGAVLSAESIPLLAVPAWWPAPRTTSSRRRGTPTLHARGILYAPDYVINAGGVIHLAGYERLGWDDARMTARLDGIGETLTELFDRAEREGITPAAAAIGSRPSASTPPEPEASSDERLLLAPDAHAHQQAGAEPAVHDRERPEGPRIGAIGHAEGRVDREHGGGADLEHGERP